MTAQPGPGRQGDSVPVAALAVGFWVGITAWFVILGSDLLWVVALGDTIRAQGFLPRGLPYASAPQAEWHNPLALAEVLLSLVNAAGPAGLAVLQLLLVGGVLALVEAQRRRLGGSELRGALVVSAVVVGAAGSLVIARLPALSLVPFVLALLILRRQHERASREIWWLVPLYLLWGNLHGGVLVGLAVLGVFLAASPGAGPLVRRVGVGVGCGLALLATSAGPRTPEYYRSALGNEAAARGSELWSAPSVSQPLDVAMILASLVLFALAVRGGLPLWEWLAVVGLAVGTLTAARHGVWLVLFLAPAALRARGEAGRSPGGSVRVRTGIVLATALVAGGALWARGPAVHAPGSQVLAAVREAAAGVPVLAEEPLAETLAQGGVTVWAANPIDAFPQPVQAAFLDFLDTGVVPPGADVGLVVVSTQRSEQVRRGGGWVEQRRLPGYVVLAPAG